MEWSVLYSSPRQTGRYEDIYFIDARRGWGVAGTSTVIHTTDGGDSWTSYVQTDSFKLYFRSVTFLDSLRGVIGTLSPAHPIIVTDDGGKTFSVPLFSGVKPAKICGLFLRDSVINGVGAYDGTPTYVRSTDRGATWTGKAMSAQAVSLVDCYFFDAHTGLAVGSVGGTRYNDGNSVVLRTTNGGADWSQVYRSGRTREWGWKIYFLNDSVGYVGIEARTTLIYYLKTVDRGKTWTEQLFVNNYDVEGIGFLNESTGWIGGWSGPTYQTTDSGATWAKFSESDSMRFLNRIRRVNDSLLFGAGTRIFRYAPKQPTAVRPMENIAPQHLTVFQNYPNPFNPNTTIDFELFSHSIVRINIYNAIGQLVESVMDNPKPPGRYRLQWIPRSDLSGGVYFYQIQTENAVTTKSMLYLK